MTERTQAGRSHHSRPRDCRAVRVSRPVSRPFRRQLPMAVAGEAGTGCRKSHWRGIMISRGWTPLILRIVRLFMMTGREGEGNPLVCDLGDRLSVRPTAAPEPASQETCHACRAISPRVWGESPAASTEVVVAEDRIFAPGRAIRDSARAPLLNVGASRPPSALPGISPTGGEITRGAIFASRCRFDVLQRHQWNDAPAPSQSPSLWGRCPAGQRGVAARLCLHVAARPHLREAVCQ